MGKLSKPLGVHASLEALGSTLSQCLSIDLDSTVELSGEALGRFKEYFSVDSEDLGVYYNEFNLVFTIKTVFEEVQGFLKCNDVKILVDSSAYNVFLAVYSRFNDSLVTQIIDG